MLTSAIKICTGKIAIFMSCLWKLAMYWKRRDNYDIS